MNYVWNTYGVPMYITENVSDWHQGNIQTYDFRVGALKGRTTLRWRKRESIFTADIEKSLTLQNWSVSSLPRNR